jgi:hypothetical protein
VAVDIPGDPAEGAAVVFSALKGSFPVAFLHQAPSVGDVTLAERTSGVWVAVQPGSATSPPPPPPPPSPCTVTINTGGCRVDNSLTQYAYPGNSCTPARFPVNANNWYLGATITVTGPNGFSVSKPAPDGDHFDWHSVTFTIPGNLCTATLTATASAPGYQTYSMTFIPINLINAGDPLYVPLTPDTMLYFMMVWKCGDNSPCPPQDRSGATVDIAGFGSGTTDSNGCVYITGPNPPWGSPDTVTTITVSYPASPYYETLTGRVNSIAGCTNNAGGWIYLQEDVTEPAPTVAGLDLKPGYNCYSSAFKGDCTGFNANLEIINTLVYKQRPYPTTLHATINGIACTLTDDGSGYFTGQVSIHGLCWEVALPAGSGGSFGGLYPVDTFGIYLHTYILMQQGAPIVGTPVIPWVPAQCVPAGGGARYDWECGCNPGDGLWAFLLLEAVVFIALLDTDGPGSLPLNAQSTGVVINMPGHPGNPITGDAQVTE